MIENSIIRSKLFSWKSTNQKLVSSIKTIIETKNNVSKDRKILPYNILLSNLQNIFEKINSKKIDHEALLKQIAASITLNDQQAKKYQKSNIDFSNDIKWKIEGPVDSNYSLAILNRNFIYAMSQTKLDIHLHCIKHCHVTQHHMVFLLD